MPLEADKVSTSARAHFRSFVRSLHFRLSTVSLFLSFSFFFATSSRISRISGRTEISHFVSLLARESLFLLTRVPPRRGGTTTVNDGVEGFTRAHSVRRKRSISARESLKRGGGEGGTFIVLIFRRTRARGARKNLKRVVSHEKETP